MRSRDRRGDRSRSPPMGNHRRTRRHDSALHRRRARGHLDARTRPAPLGLPSLRRGAAQDGLRRLAAVRAGVRRRPAPPPRAPRRPGRRRRARREQARDRLLGRHDQHDGANRTGCKGGRRRHRRLRRRPPRARASRRTCRAAAGLEAAPREGARGGPVRRRARDGAIANRARSPHKFLTSAPQVSGYIGSTCLEPES